MPIASVTKSPLPKPDERGHYWLGAKPRMDSPTAASGAVIFKASRFGNRPKGTADVYFVSKGVMGGVLFKNGEIQYFDSPEEALKALLEAGYEGEGKS